MKEVLILGSTGSIGTQTLDIIRNNGDRFRAVGLTCRSRLGDLIEQIREFAPRAVCVGSEDDAKRVRSEFPNIDVTYGEQGLVDIAAMDCDIVLNALMGISGLAPTYEAIGRGREIALANKETLVAGGKLITDSCKENGVKIIPVDSEHSAIFQCLEGNGGSACARAFRDKPEGEAARPVRRILLTASGGPFKGMSIDDLKKVTPKQALKHPNWDMGAKITIDSATMMNKGLEVIEARWLFDIDADRIDVHVHPESIVHSMVEFMDGSVMAQMGLPDMKIPIGLALAYPGRLSLLDHFSGRDEDRTSDGSLDFFTKGANLTFEKADRKTFRCLDIAYAAIKEGGSMPIAMNGANEELVAMFLAGKISFLDIAETIEKVIGRIKAGEPKTVDDVLSIDREARKLARELLEQ